MVSASGGPPAIARKILAVVLPSADRDSVCRDVAELYALRVERDGVAAARRWYRRQVSSFIVALLRERWRRFGSFTRPPFQPRGEGVMLNWWYDLRSAFNRLRRTPVFSIVAALTLAIGVGVFTSVFTLIDTVLIEPMPYRAPTQLRWVWRDYTWAGFPRGWLGGPDIVGLREQTDVFAGVAAFRPRQLNLSAAGSEQANQASIVFVTHEFFDLLGVPVADGRGFRPEDDYPDANRVVVLAYDTWRVQFGSDPTVVGTTIRIDGQPATVVGIAPATLHFVQQASLSEPVKADVFANLAMDLGSIDPGSGLLAGLVRVREGVGSDQLQAALVRAARTSDDFFRNQGLRLWPESVKGALVDEVKPALTAIFAAAAFLLLVLSANLATLLLGRAALRQRELGIRAALGANRSRLASSVFSESLMLGLLGAVIGVSLAYLGTEIIVRIAPENMPRLDEVAMGGASIVVGITLSFLAIFAANVAPAVNSVRANLVRSFREGGRTGESRSGARLRGALVASQVALSLLLLVSAGLVADAFARLLRADPGFDPGRALAFRVSLARAQYPEAENMREFDRRLRERLAALPGVTQVGGANALPLTTSTNQNSVAFPGAPGNTGDKNADEPLIDVFQVTPGYLEAAGFRILAGRSFADGDGDRTVVVVDDVLARRFFPEGSAVGSRLVMGDEFTIVGVVDQARLYNVHADDRGQVYYPFERFPDRQVSYVVRSSIDPETLAGLLRGVVQETEPAAALTEIRTLESIVRTSLGKQRLSLTLLAAFAGGALLLATLGIYGVVANAVLRRRQEIAIRMALGADRSRVVRMVLWHGLRLTTMGAAMGLLGAMVTARMLRNVMFGVDATNPAVYLLVAIVVMGVAMLASYLPAMGATRITPLAALRAE